LRLDIRSKIPLILIAISPLLSAPWMSQKNFLIVSILALASAMLANIKYEVSTFLSLISLSYVMAAAYRSPGPFISTTVFAIGVLSIGWIPKEGSLETITWWLLASVPLSLVVIFSKVSSGEGVYLMLLLLVLVMAVTYSIDPQGIRAALRGVRIRPSTVNLLNVGSKVFEILFYILTIYLGFHLRKGYIGIAAVILGLILRRFVSGKYTPLIVSILFLLLYYLL
jgi:hypothetical protein